MLEYEFWTIRTNKGVFVGRTEGYREMILKRAEQGWRYAGWIPSKMGSYGAITEIDLIFEREVNT